MVDCFLLRDAEFEAQRAGPGRSDATGHGACRVGQGPRALGRRDAVDRAEQRWGAGIVGGRAHRRGHEIGDGCTVVGRAEPDEDGQAGVEGAGGSGHDGRCYGPTMATGDEGRWAAALEGFDKESFEADGKRRGPVPHRDGPAVIVISEIPGITPLVADFGRRVAAAGCTAVLPRLFGDPGRPASVGYAAAVDRSGVRLA